MNGPERRGPWDAGLQPERTSLAWSRTCLALGGVALLTTRAFVGSGTWVAFWLAVGLILLGAAGVWWGANRRSDATVQSLHRDGDLAGGPGGRLLLVTAVSAFLVTVVNAALVLASHKN